MRKGKWDQYDREKNRQWIGALALAGMIVLAIVVFQVIQRLGGDGGRDPELRGTTEQTRKAWTTYTASPTRARPDPTPDFAIATIDAMLSGCGGLPEFEQKQVYWSLVVAQDKVEDQAARQGTSVDYALADLAVMTHYGISASTLKCVHDKGNKNEWPMPSR